MSSSAIEDFVAEEPPTQLGSGDMCEQQGPYTSGAASSAAIPIAHIPTPYGEAFVTFVIATNPVRFNFGDANVAAATANSAALPVGKHRLRITAKTSYFRHIQQTGAGTFDVWRSSR